MRIEMGCLGVQAANWSSVQTQVAKGKVDSPGAG